MAGHYARSRLTQEGQHLGGPGALDVTGAETRVSASLALLRGSRVLGSPVDIGRQDRRTRAPKGPRRQPHEQWDSRACADREREEGGLVPGQNRVCRHGGPVRAEAILTHGGGTVLGLSVSHGSWGAAQGWGENSFPGRSLRTPLH